MRRAHPVNLGIIVVVAAQVVAGLGCSGLKSRPEPEELKRRYEAAVADPTDDGRLKAYLDILPRMKCRYVMEGDLLATANEVRQALAAVHVSRTAPLPGPAPQPPPPAPAVVPPVPAHLRPAAAPAVLRRKLDLGDRYAFKLREFLPPARGGRPVPLLKVETLHGAALFWGDTAQRTFVAEVDAASFAGAPRSAADLTAALEEAGRGWAALCAGCDIRFTTGSEAAPGAVHFKVVYFPEDVAGALAISFTPRAEPDDRVLWILPPFFAGTTPPAGVLRHELGHILGYLHEQVGTASVCGEVGPGEWKRVTADDPASVMHYFCGPKDDPRLEFSRLDCVGHHQVYGSGVPEPACVGPW